MVMHTSELATEEGAVSHQARLGRRAIVAFYASAGVLLAVYGFSLLWRHPGQIWPFIDNWIIDGVEIAAALACLARGFSRRPDRLPALTLGAGLLAWSMGDVLWTLLGDPSNPSIADAFYLAFYPLAYLALMFFVRSHVGHVQPSAWLDGAIAGLGAAAVCAAFALDTILNAIGGSSTTMLVNASYPAGDLVLLALAVGALVIVPRRSPRLLAFAGGCALMALGDTIYLFQSSSNDYAVGTLLDLTWPLAMFAMSLSVWLPGGEATRGKQAERTHRFLVPGMAVVAGLLILVVGNLGHVSNVAIVLASVVLCLAALRLAMSLHELRKLTESRQREAVSDQLTGLGNRRRLLDELDEAFARPGSRRSGEQMFALLLMDLDHFKEINDSFGHPTGDALLRKIGPLLRDAVRPDDLVTRLGGDEFAILLPGADVRVATAVAGRITESLSSAIAVDEASLHVAASIGIALAPDDATTPAELLRCADVAMYRAKSAHADFDTYEVTLDDGIDRLLLVEELRDAMAEGGLTLHYQPEIDLHTGEVVAVEALIRWPHPRLGLIPPDHFLSLAEEAGLIRRITEWVLVEAVAACANWWRAGHQAAVAVNILATDLLDASLPDQVEALLARAGLPPQALILEITEAMVMADLMRARRVIEGLSDLGVVVSIDDFGTGFSSLAYLSDLAVGELKLDRMFTGRLHAGVLTTRDEAIVHSVIDLGHALGLRVVAEGIERRELVGFLAELGCDRGQGFGIQAPRPSGELDFAGLTRRTGLTSTGPAH